MCRSATGTFFASGGVQPAHLVWSELPPGSRLQLRVAERAEGNSLEGGHRMSNRLAHLAHLTITSFADDDGQGAVPVADVGRRCLPAVEDDSPGEAPEIAFVRKSENLRLIRARNAVPRMSQPRC